MKRIVLSMMVAALLTVALAVPAFATSLGPFPGPNSYAPGDVPNEEANFGNCQSQLAKEPESASSAQTDNPAIFTKGQTQGYGIFCVR